MGGLNAAFVVCMFVCVYACMLVVVRGGAECCVCRLYVCMRVCLYVSGGAWGG